MNVMQYNGEQVVHKFNFNIWTLYEGGIWNSDEMRTGKKTRQKE